MLTNSNHTYIKVEVAVVGEINVGNNESQLIKHDAKYNDRCDHGWNAEESCVCSTEGKKKNPDEDKGGVQGRYLERKKNKELLAIRIWAQTGSGKMWRLNEVKWKQQNDWNYKKNMVGALKLNSLYPYHL